ncbi:uncharacterized protein LOC124269389 isoform X2 [Haliotis rubra]|uniref:uncharacterized protein LOC124269389 isoform X2 n=1 Tax=Haliotis rubra TaxID=36100 RepID=UPI001EE5AF41|nr:uncharacterized protein LOC124269389 isoform X2 [Haliotis rubra]
MASLVVVLLLFASSVQLSSSKQVPEDSVQELYEVASSYSECTNINRRTLRYARGIVLVVRSACRKDEDSFRAALNKLQCSDITSAVSRYCSRRYTRSWAINLVCRFVRKVNERCEESDDSLCQHAITTTPEPPTTTAEVPTTDPPTTPPTPPTTTEVPTPNPPTTQPTTTLSGPVLPEIADKTFLTACPQECVRNDLVGSLCTGATLSDECNNLQPPATDGSYTCCLG